MRLRQELEAKFIKYIPPGEGYPYGGHKYVDTLAESDGIWFLCPKCFQAKGDNIGVHGMICWFTGKVPKDAEPGPGRWNPSGTGLDDLSFTGPGAYSVKLEGGCDWHGFVENGHANP